MITGNFIINRKTLISMIFIGFAMLGVISYSHLPLELFPDIELPFLIIQVNSFQQSDPETIEKEAIIPLEGAAGSLEKIDSIESFADQGRGTVFIYFKKNTNLKYAYLKLLERVNETKSDLPPSYFVNVVRIDTQQMANRFMTLQVRGKSNVDRLREIADREIVRELESIDGISNVEASGGRKRSVNIALDTDACETYGITPAKVNSLISENSRGNLFVGNVRENGRFKAVKVHCEYSSVLDLENIVINSDGPLLLKDVADISFGKKDISSISRVNGKSAVTIQLVKDSQVNLIELSDHTRSVIKRLNKNLKNKEIEIVIQSDTAEGMKSNINQIIRLALIGGILAVIILWVFLKNIRLVLIIAIAIPVSIFTALNFFYAFGISINSLTLVGMALAIGMLLDNSIVVLENIYRLASEGKALTSAVLGGVKEVWKSVVAGTLTTITVFLPFLFSQNFLISVIGKHTGVSIISTLLISLIAALVLIPMTAHIILKRSGFKKSHQFSVVSRKNRLIEIYNVLLKSSFRYPARVIVSAVVLFFISLLSALALSVNVTEETEAESFNIYVTMPAGATLESTDKAVSELEKRLEGLEEMEDLICEIKEEEAVLTINLKDDYYNLRNRDIESVKNIVNERTGDFKAADISFEQPRSSARYRGGRGGRMGGAIQNMFGLGSPQEKVVIRGGDYDNVKRLAEDIEYYLEDLSSVNRASMNISEDSPEIHLRFDPRLLSYYGINANQIMSELRSFPSEVESQVSFKKNDEEYDIIITKSGQAEEDKGVDDLREIIVVDNNGLSHKIDELANLTYSYGKPTISRVNQEKQIEVTYNFLSEVNDSRKLLESSRQEVDNLIAGLNIPPGIAVEVEHEENDYSEYIYLIGAAFILIYMILASIFQSLTTPVVIMFTIPLAATGALWLLIFTGTSILNAYTLTGLLILLGVVVNNGIILIDYSLILRRRGFRYSRALMTAGQARVRPILITTITTIVAMIPLAMGRSEETSLVGAPFAIAIIGGLSLSALFTLIFIPVVFSGLRKSLKWIMSRAMWLKFLQLSLFIISGLYIYARVENTLWRMILLFSAVMIIPSAVWFITNSLKRAKSEYISDDEPIVIKIRNLTKIYQHPSKFVREWNKGKERRRKEQGEMEGRSRLDFRALFWQLPLLSFLVYFVYFYLHSSFWLFALSIPVYLFILFIWRRISPYLTSAERRKMSKNGKTKTVKIAGIIIFWFIPLFNLLIFFFTFDDLATVIFIAIIWYAALAIYHVSKRLREEKINTARITGRFSRARRFIYRFVQNVPLIGKRKNPFPALFGVSLEIEKGMFGLLGPNGAGKTTLMRIICGILDQSYGKITINGFDTLEKREELQGLIGYLPQEFGLYENMTAVDFLNYQAILKGITDPDRRKEIVQRVLSAVHIEERKNDKINTFSGGMKQRVGIAQILLHMPRILVVDEPTAGLDPRERIRFRNLLMELSRERVVIFSTHIIEDISSSCSKVAVLDMGKLLYLGKPADMTKKASGKVWQFKVEPEEFEEINRELRVIYHTRDGGKIKVRCLNDRRPSEEAIEVTPTLEDSYLLLLRKEEEIETA